MSEEAKKRLRLMTYWLFGTVVIAWGGVLAFARSHFEDWNYIVQSAWVTLLIIGVVAVLIYLLYRFVILPREK